MNETPTTNSQETTDNNNANSLQSTDYSQKTNKFNDIKTKVLSIISNLIIKLKTSKFYANKKIFWLVTGVLGLLFLTLIIGLIFGKRGNGGSLVKNTPKPSPVVENTPPPEDKDGLLLIEQKLSDIKGQINSMDVKQSRLQPPTVNFDIKF